PDLVPIVVLRLDPEDRDDPHSVIPGRLLGEPERGQRLEEREQRPAEQTRLLAREDGDGVGRGELGGGGLRRGGRAAAALLSGENRGDLRPPARVLARAGDGGSPVRGLRRIASEERRDGAEVVRVVGRE